MIAIGPVADDVSHDFERYWTCASVAPAELIVPEVDAAMITSVAAAAARIAAAPEALAYMNALAELPFVHDLLAAYSLGLSRTLLTGPPRDVVICERAA